MAAVKFGLILLAALIIISFFLPWVSVHSPAVAGISKVLTGKKQETIDSISGFDVPMLANSSESRFMIEVIQIFNPGIKNADKKSYLIWIVPLLAVAMLAALWLNFANKWLHLFCAAISFLLFFVSLYKIMTTDMDKLVLNVRIASGLWLVLYAYLGIGILCALNFGALVRNK